MSTKFAWIDLETTGLHHEKDSILSIGVIVTDTNLQELARIEVDVWQPQEVLDRMPPFVRDMHLTSSLMYRSQMSDLDVHDAEAKVLNLLKPHLNDTLMMAGSSIAFDRVFIRKFMPGLNALLHYRHLDVSVLKILVMEWMPKSRYHGKTEKAHTPLADLDYSIAELKWYRDILFDSQDVDEDLF